MAIQKYKLMRANEIICPVERHRFRNACQAHRAASSVSIGAGRRWRKQMLERSRGVDFARLERQAGSGRDDAASKSIFPAVERRNGLASGVVHLVSFAYMPPARRNGEPVKSRRCSCSVSASNRSIGTERNDYRRQDAI